MCQFYSNAQYCNLGILYLCCFIVYFKIFRIFKIEFYVSGSVSVIGPHSDGVRLHLAILLCPLFDIQDLCQPYKMGCSPASSKSLIFSSSLMLTYRNGCTKESSKKIKDRKNKKMKI